MPGSRADILKSMVEQDPTGAFGRYGLAMEYVNGGELEAAVETPHLGGAVATYQAATWERDLNPRRNRIRSTCDSTDRSVMPRRSAI